MVFTAPVRREPGPERGSRRNGPNAEHEAGGRELGPAHVEGPGDSERRDLSAGLPDRDRAGLPVDADRPPARPPDVLVDDRDPEVGE